MATGRPVVVRYSLAGSMPRRVVERGGDVVGRDPVAGGRAHRLVVAGADDLAPLHAAAAHQDEHGARDSGRGRRSG